MFQRKKNQRRTQAQVLFVILSLSYKQTWLKMIQAPVSQNYKLLTRGTVELILHHDLDLWKK